MLCILISTYNRSTSLKNHLSILSNNILSNNLTEQIKIVISENGSDHECTMDNKKFIEHLKSLGININYIINKKNIGLSRNIEKIIKEGAGDYIWLNSDDDDYTNSPISEVVKILNENKPDVFFIPTDAVNVVSHDIKSNECNIFSAEQLSIDRLDKYSGFLGSTIVRRKLLTSVCEIEAKQKGQLENNYFIRILNLSAYRSSSLALVSSKLSIKQNIVNGSYFFNDAKVCKKSFWTDLQQIYKNHYENYEEISPLDRKIILNKYFNNRSYMLFMRSKNEFSIKDVFQVYLYFRYLSSWGIIISFMPVVICKITLFLRQKYLRR